MEEIVNENSELGSESNCKPSAGGIKDVQGFKRGHPYLESRNAATSEIRKKKQLRVAAKTEYSRVVHVMIVDC